MDAIKINPTYPQKVEVVNDPLNPNKVEVSNLPISPVGYVQVQVTSGTISAVRTSASNLFIVRLDNILLLNGDGTFSPIPLNSEFVAVSQAQIDSLLSSYKTAYATLVSGVSAATLHYSKQTSSGSVTSEVYNLKD